MAHNFATGSTLKNQFEPNKQPQNPAKTGMIFAQRTLNAKNQIILPTGTNPMPNLYVPQKLPAFTDGLTALQYLKKQGYQYSLGLSYEDTYVAPDVVIVQSATGLTTLTWNSPVIGVQNLVGQNPTGTITQGTASAAIRSVNVVDNISTIVVVPVDGAVFTTSSPINVNATLNKLAPNPKLSDSICVAVFGYYQQYITSPQYTTSPDCWISVSVSGNDTSINPSGKPIALVKPTAVSTSGTTAYLTYPIGANNLGLLPTTPLGDSSVTQGTVTGVFAGYTITSTNCVIQVNNITGAFKDTDPINVLLDSSQTGFNYLKKQEVSSFALGGWDVLNEKALRDKHPAFVAGVIAMRSPIAQGDKKYNAQGYFGYHFTKANEAVISTITQPDSEGFVYSITLDVNSIYQFSAEGINAVQHMYLDLNNQYPFYATSGDAIFLNQDCGTDTTVYPNLEIANQLTEQGCTVFLPDQTTGLRTVFNNVSCLQTVSSKNDYEYRYQATQLKVRWVDKNLVEVGNLSVINPDGTRKNNNPETTKSLKQNLFNVLTIGYNNGNGILGNTDNNISITLNPEDVTRYLITATTTVTPPNNGIDFIAVFKSYTL